MHDLEREGWCWAVGYSKDRGHYAEVWRDLLMPIDGRYREHKIELAKTTQEAEEKLRQRLIN